MLDNTPISIVDNAQVNIVAIIAASWLIPASDSISALVNIMYTLATNVVHPANTSVLMI